LTPAQAEAVVAREQAETAERQRRLNIEAAESSLAWSLDHFGVSRTLVEKTLGDVRARDWASRLSGGRQVLAATLVGDDPAGLGGDVTAAPGGDAAVTC
jgi:hypothetical protein